MLGGSSEATWEDISVNETLGPSPREWTSAEIRQQAPPQCTSRWGAVMRKSGAAVLFLTPRCKCDINPTWSAYLKPQHPAQARHPEHLDPWCRGDLALLLGWEGGSVASLGWTPCLCTDTAGWEGCEGRVRTKNKAHNSLLSSSTIKLLKYVDNMSEPCWNIYSRKTAYAWAWYYL